MYHVLLIQTVYKKGFTIYQKLQVTKNHRNKKHTLLLVR